MVEYIHYRFPRGQSEEKSARYQLTAGCCCTIPRVVVDVYTLIVTFLFGAAVTQCVTDVTKYSAGRLRPNFLDVCQPNITAGLCDDGRVAGVYDYVYNYSCSRPESSVYDSRY